MKLVKRFWNDESAPAMPEYALMIALVAVVAIAAVTVLGTNILARFTEVADAVGPDAVGG